MLGLLLLVEGGMVLHTSCGTDFSTCEDVVPVNDRAHSLALPYLSGVF